MTVSDYQWAFLTISKATLIASSSYTLSAFPWQSDQVTPLLGWKEPQRNGTLRPRPTRLAANADLSRRPDGTWTFTWAMPPMTPLQFFYLITNQWSSGSTWSAAATVQTWDDNVNGYSVFNVTAIRPTPGQDYGILDGMYMDVKYSFVGGVLL